MKLRNAILGTLIVALSAAGMLWLAPTAEALQSVPNKYVYNGHLLDSAGAAVTTEVNIRFSFWTDQDSVAGNVTSTGAIHEAASTYADYQEVFTVTPNSDGYFSVDLGSGTSLPGMDSQELSTLLNLFLQVEVKSSGAANTAYELLDCDPDDPTIDRSPVLSVPFAQNADFLDQRDTGFGSGNIAVLGSGGIFPVSTTPDGTNLDRFVIDKDDTNASAGSIKLQFGDTLNETIAFNVDVDQFIISNDVVVQGSISGASLTVSNLEECQNIITDIYGNLACGPDEPLKVSSGAGLTVRVASGSYRINGNITNFAGSSSVVLPDASTSFLYFTSTGFVATVGGFPTDKSFIPLAEVTTAGGAVTNIIDRTVLQDDDREQSQMLVFHPEYQGAGYDPDGTNNVGQLQIANDTATGRNYYKWTSTIETLQDYDVVLRVTLSPDFIRWQRNPFELAYRTTTTNTGSAKLDISVFDTAGAPVTLSGATTDLASTSWAATEFTFVGSPTWTAGDDFLVKIKLSSSGSTHAHAGEFKIKYVDLLKE